MGEDRRSPLHDVQVAAGAEFMWEDGWPWANKITDPAAEYEAIRSGVGIWDLYSTCKYEVTGQDAARLVQRRFTGDATSLEPGRVRYGAFVNDDGLMVDDGNVYRFAEDRFWVMINTADLEEWFRATADGLDATIEHRTEELPMISVQGPGSRELLSGLTDRPLGGLRYFQFWPESVSVAGHQAYVLRTGFSGELGFELVTDPDSVAGLWEALAEAGGVPFGLEAIDLARTEVGLIIIAIDYQPGETSPYDLSMDRFIKPGTECVGSSALAAYGANPPKRFVSLAIDGQTAPEYGAGVTRGGEAVGTVTSPAKSPRLGTIGLAVLSADAAEEGSPLDVAIGDGTAPAQVGPLNRYDPERLKPRA
jgi:aminomethyltransferase